VAEERLVFNIFAQLREDGFAKASRAARATSDDVVALGRRLDEIGRKSETARVGLAGNKEMLAQLDALQVKMIRAGGRITPEMSLEGAAKVGAELAALDVGFDKLDAKAGESAAAVGAGGLSGPSGMGALIGAGVALSPVLVTLGFGLAGFGAAAVGVAKPIADAASKTGGLRANMAKLNPEQQAVARSILGLGKEYSAFEKSLQPEVLRAFSTAIHVAGNVMHDVAPVAKVTGKAFDDFLAQFGQTLQDPEWKQFWAFMAQTAPTDMHLLGQAFIDIANDIPPAVQALQPFAVKMLQVTDLGAKLISKTEHPNSNSILGELDKGVHHNVLGLGSLVQGWDAVMGSAKTAAPPMHTLAQTFTLAGLRADAEKIAVNSLTGSLTKMVTPLLTLQGDQLGWMQATQSATAAIRQNSKSLDGNSVSALAARQAILQSTNAAITFAGQEVTVHHNVQAASNVLQTQITYLEKHAGKSKFAAAEIDALRAALNKLPASVRANVDIIGHGRGGISYNDQIAGQRKTGFLEFKAAGGPVGGVGTGTSDSNLIAASKGEWVMRTAAVEKYGTAMMAAINAGRFAAGGLVGSRTVLDKGIPYVAATGASFEHAVVQQDIRALMAAALQAAKAVSAFAAGGPGGGAPAANAALARRMFPRWGSGAEWGAWNYLAMRESGWNQFARNPSSGAYGIAQALPLTKYPFAGQPAGGSNPAAQIAWMASYISGRYGDPIRAAQHEAAFNWYGDGFHGWFDQPTVIGVGERGRERVDIGGGGGGNTYNITVNVAPGANLAEAGRVMVGAIREYEKRSGPGWRK